MSLVNIFCKHEVGQICCPSIQTIEKKMKLFWLLGLLQAAFGFDKTLQIEGLKIHGDGAIGTSDSVNFRVKPN